MASAETASVIKWEYDDRVGKWINPKTGEERSESYSQDEIEENTEASEEIDAVNNGADQELSDGLSDDSADPETDAGDESQKPAFTLSREQIGQGMRWTRDEDTGEPLPCPNCGRGLVLVPRESKLFHVCCSLLESEYPSCDFFEKVVKESTKPDYGKDSKSGTGKKVKKVPVAAIPNSDEAYPYRR